MPRAWAAAQGSRHRQPALGLERTARPRARRYAPGVTKRRTPWQAGPEALPCRPMDAQTFLGITPMGGDNCHWRLHVTRDVATPGDFLFGGCGLSAALVALEEAAARPTVWATAQYLSYAPTGSMLDLQVTLAATGGNITQARAVGCVGQREILTVNAALGVPHLDISETWVTPPEVPPPSSCPERTLPAVFGRSILDRVDVRIAKGRGFEDLGGVAGDPDSALWARVPGHLEPSAATLAIFGDYVSGAASQPLGRNAMGRSLDNTLRVARLVPTEWVLCDLRIHAIVGGYAQGVAFLWSQDRVLMATASQSFSVRYGPDNWHVPG